MLGAKQGKIWGRTNLVFGKNNVSVHHVFITGHKHCSKHMHEQRYNMFYVLRGEILIKCWKNDYELVDKTHLEEGQFTVVSPGEMHQFETGAGGCELLEIYFVELDDRDIIRETVGGENEA